MLHQLRWRKAPRDHRLLWVALAIALVLHVFFIVIVWYEMRLGVRQVETAAPQLETAIQVRLIFHASAASQPVPVPEVPPPPPRPAREPVSKNAMTLHMPGPAPIPTSTPQPAPASSTHVMLFDRTGRIILPANATSAPAAPSADYVQRGPQGDTQIMQNQAGAKYQSAPNPLKKYFPPPKESLVGGLMRKLNGSESNTKSVDLPHGIHLKCQKVFGIPIPNCGIPPDPPPSNDGDERLNMAPASLVKGVAPKAPDLAVCIADYKAGKPLPYGCPVDTPARAVDAEQHTPEPGH